MKKYIFSLLLAIAGVMTAFAEDVKTYVVVEFKSCELLKLALSDKPKAEFKENNLVLTAENFEGSYTTADIKRFYFEDVADGIKAIDADKQSAGDIYDLNGRKVASYKGTIDATTLPEGVYVVKTLSGKSFKVVKK